MSAELWVVLLAALIQVESGGVPQIGDQHLKNKAYGVLQVRQPCLDDVNEMHNMSLTLEDCHGSESISRWVCVNYLTRWGEHYSKTTDKEPTMEVLARIWVGGPSGYRRQSTEKYWEKVKKELETARDRKEMVSAPR